MNAIKRLWNLCRKNIQDDKSNKIILTNYYKVKINIIAERVDLVHWRLLGCGEVFNVQTWGGVGGGLSGDKPEMPL